MRPLITAAFALSLLGGTSALADPHNDRHHGDQGSSQPADDQNKPAPHPHEDGGHADRHDHAGPAHPGGPVNVPVATPAPPATHPTGAGTPARPGRPGQQGDWRGDHHGQGGGGGGGQPPPAHPGAGSGDGHNGGGHDQDWRNHGASGGQGHNGGGQGQGHDQDWRDHHPASGDHHPGPGGGDHDQNWRDHNNGGHDQNWRNDDRWRNRDWRNNNWRQRDNDWRPPSNWNGRHGWLDQRRYPPVRWAQRRFHWQNYYAPQGWYARTWNYGDFLPWAWFGEDYYINDYYEFGLPPPPEGYTWVRVGDDALLVDQYTGQVVEVEKDLFY